KKVEAPYKKTSIWSSWKAERNIIFSPKTKLGYIDRELLEFANMDEMVEEAEHGNVVSCFLDGCDVRLHLPPLIIGLMYHDLYLGGKALVERENVGFDLTKSNLCPSLVEDLTAKGVGLRLADSHTVHISRFNPFGMAKLTIFAVIRKAYGGEPSVDLLRAFMNLGLTEMDFRSFMMEGIDGEFHFVLEGGVGDGEGSSLHIKFVKKETLDSDDALSKKDVANEARNQKLGKPSKATRKRKQVAESSKRETRQKAQKRTRKLMPTLTNGRASYDDIWESEMEKDKAYAELEKKCNNALQDLDKIPLMLDMHVEIETLQGQVDKLHGFEFERERLKKSKTQLLYTTLKEVAALREPFELEKMPGYHPLSKKEFDQVGDNLAITSYPFLDEVTDDPYASLEVLLSKKPKTLRSKPAPSTSKFNFTIFMIIITLDNSFDNSSFFGHTNNCVGSKNT
ncbi:hypothetical protein Tco_1306478, partial [Tanacetum coccineum]